MVGDFIQTIGGGIAGLVGGAFDAIGGALRGMVASANAALPGGLFALVVFVVLFVVAWNLVKR
jgi:FAD/FMN-containing dehydrogenase